MIHIEDSPGIRKRNAEISFLLFVLGGFAGLLNLTRTLPFGSGFETFAIARNLAHEGTFANPLLVLPSGPSALAPPLYPALLALFMKVLPSPSYVLLVAALGDVIMNAITAALLPRISWLLFGEVGPGIAAAILWLMSAQLIPSWDANYTVTALLFFCLFSAVTMNKQRVLEIFAANSRFITPDEIRTRLQNYSQRSSVYSYLSRLCRQELLEKAQGLPRVAYRITPRGMERLRFFRSQGRM